MTQQEPAMGVSDEAVKIAENAFWPAYLEAKRTHGKQCHETGMRAALLAALPHMQGQATPVDGNPPVLAGEAVAPFAFMKANQNGEFIRCAGGDKYAFPVYTTPPAPVRTLRELADTFVPDDDNGEEETEFDRGYEQALQECRDRRTV